MMAVSEPQFRQFAVDWQRVHPEFPVKFVRIDFTSVCDDYSPITSLPGYVEFVRKAGHHPFGGNGEWAWIADGSLVDIGPVIDVPTDELISRTEAAFAVPRRN